MSTLMRSPTKSAIERRSAIIVRLEAGPATANELRQFLASRKSIYVAVDTVQRDLRVLAKVHTVYPIRRRYYGGWQWGLSRGQD